MTPEKSKATFLEAFAAEGMVKAACEKVGISRQTAYRWRQQDEGFALAWHDVEEDITEQLEREARRRAAEGVAKPVFHQGQVVGAIKEFSDTLLIFLLKARRPEMYRDRYEVKHGGSIQHTSRPDYSKLSTEELAELERITRAAE